MKKLPPLKSLRAFEATARYLSFSKAAEELFVTPGAVSQQVKLLEEFLGVALFRRLHRRILLTDAGQCLLPGIQDGFERISEALEDITEMDSGRPLTVSSAPSFATKWLVPRLNSLREVHPDIDIRIDTSMALVDLARSDIDVGIRFGMGDYPGMNVDLLFSQEVFPVCSPSLIQRNGHSLESPEDLRHYPLIHYADMSGGWPDWDMWLSAAGVKEMVDTQHGTVLLHHDLLTQAVLDGQGVALTGSVSVNEDIKAGRLIRLFDLSFPLEFSYYFVTTKAKAQWPLISKFRSWIFQEVEKDETVIRN